MSKLSFLLPIFLLFSFPGFSQNYYDFNTHITNPTCNNADGGFTVTDQNGDPLQAFIKAYHMPDSVLIGNGSTYTGLSQGSYRLVIEFVDYTTEYNVFLTNFKPLANDSMLLASLAEGVSPDTCHLGKGHIDWGSSPDIPSEYVDTLNMINWTWSNGQTGLHVTGLFADTPYWVKGGFGAGCRFFIPRGWFSDYYVGLHYGYENMYDIRTSEDTIFFKIGNDNTLNVGFVNPVKPLCALDGGSLTAVLYNSGTPPLAWKWNTGQTTTTIDHIKSGSYSIKVTDGAGCEGLNYYYLDQLYPANYTAIIQVVKPDSCYFGQGKLSATVSGGFPPYKYQWNYSPADTFSVLNNVEAQSAYSLSVTDSKGCETSDYQNVPNLNPIHLTKVLTQPDCAGQLGKISIGVTGGTAPYKYRFSAYPEDTTSVIDSLTNGGYSYTVSDANNCWERDYANLQLPQSCYRTLNLSVFRDDNGNCENDSELPIYGNQFSYELLNNTYYNWFYADYTFQVLPGLQHIQFESRPYFSPSCLDANWNLDDLVINPANSYNVKKVGLASNVPAKKNLRTILYDGALRPGFETNLYLDLRSEGNQLTDPTHITLVIPNDISFVNSTLNYTVLDAHRVRLTIPPISLGGHVWGFIKVETNASVPLGVSMQFTVKQDTMPGETRLDDNTRIFTFHTVGSYDPNDISVSPSPIIAPNETQLDYRIRFQNLGSYYAENVVLIDTLPEDVDLSTFRVEYSSHAATKIEMKGRVLTVRFLNIYLRAATYNEPMSHGEFRFSIDRYPNLVLGTKIRNAASIYFDFNAPVKTNLAEVEVNELATGVKEMISIYPNPGKDYFRVLGQDVKEVELYDISGKKQATLKAETVGTFSLSTIPSGVYILRMKTATGIKTMKLLVDKL